MTRILVLKSSGCNPQRVPTIVFPAPLLCDFAQLMQTDAANYMHVTGLN
jgi:hypothetical protein